VLKTKHQAASQGVRLFGKRSILLICEHLQKVAQRRIAA